jgi:hypothetical protein
MHLQPQTSKSTSGNNQSVRPKIQNETSSHYSQTFQSQQNYKLYPNPLFNSGNNSQLPHKKTIKEDEPGYFVKIHSSNKDGQIEYIPNLNFVTVNIVYKTIKHAWNSGINNIYKFKNDLICDNLYFR